MADMSSAAHFMIAGDVGGPGNLRDAKFVVDIQTNPALTETEDKDIRNVVLNSIFEVRGPDTEQGRSGPFGSAVKRTRQLCLSWPPRCSSYWYLFSWRYFPFLSIISTEIPQIEFLARGGTPSGILRESW